VEDNSGDIMSTVPLPLPRIALVVLGGALAACGDDSTGPGARELQLVASRFEEMVRTRAETGDPSGSLVSRDAALALRAGVRPTRVSITVDGAAGEYWALEVEHAFGDDLTESPVLTFPLTMRTMVAWRGTRLDRVIAISVFGDGGSFVDLFSESDAPSDAPLHYLASPSHGVFFDRGGPPFVAVGGGALATRQSIGGDCSQPRSTNTGGVFIPVPVSCQTAVFFTRFTMTTRALTLGGEEATGPTVTMREHDIAGMRLEYPPPPCPVCD
jgi:hypothetical protein